MPNRLADSTSPYLLQHANNPVDWYPWGPEALRRAVEEDKPIFLSIGYSACHWCHVMEHESFEDEAIAAQMNEKFVCIKVDREERPDLDQIYMTSVQIMTGHGGWPMSVFLTPELHPFYGGTYWPPHGRGGMPGFSQVLSAVADAWQHRRELAREQALQMTQHIEQVTAMQPPVEQLKMDEAIHAAVVQLEQSFDFTHGGFGAAPKFPHGIDLQLLLRMWQRTRRAGLLEMVQLSLDKMAQGGIYDHLGGGFARYSVDAQWLVPHFEKMLYDNALLIGIYLDAYLVTGNDHYADVARQTLDYVLRDMTDPEGGFYSAEDADSEGEEGKFYVWSPGEIRQVLGDEVAEKFCYVYDVTEAGNFEGHNILNMPKTLAQCAAARNWNEDQLRQEMADAREQLFATREQRVRPGRDDKVIVSWNGLMIDSMARAAGILDDPRYLEGAQRAARFLLSQLRDDDGRLLHVWRQGRAHLSAYLDDYACLANGLVSLYQADFDERWIDSAVELVDMFRQHFSDPAGGALFYTADDHEALITRTKDIHDGSVPSANGMAATVLVRLGKLLGRDSYLDLVRQIGDAASGMLSSSPRASVQLLLALSMLKGPFWEIAVVGDTADAGTATALRDLRSRYLPNAVVACRGIVPNDDPSPWLDPLFEGRTDGLDQPAVEQPTVYVCEGHVCQAPVSGVEQARAKWDSLQ